MLPRMSAKRLLMLNRVAAGGASFPIGSAGLWLLRAGLIEEMPNGRLDVTVEGFNVLAMYADAPR